VQAKGMCNIFNNNNKKTQKISKSRQNYAHPVQEASRTPNRPDQNRTTPQHIIIKTTIQRLKKEY
jgi:hypothetical protein